MSQKSLSYPLHVAHPDVILPVPLPTILITPTLVTEFGRHNSEESPRYQSRTPGPLFCSLDCRRTARLTQAVEYPQVPANHHVSAPPPTVLIVDDDRELVDLLTLFLSRQGIIALPASSGQQCIEEVRQKNIDVIVLDVMMPGMDGLEVCRVLKTIDSARSIPIMLLTARSDLETRLEGLQAGASEVLVKPIRGQDLLARIQAQVEVSRKARQTGQELATIKKESSEE